jgi:hypothetical protein
MERQEQRHDEEDEPVRSEEAAAKSGIQKQEPEQDDTENPTIDTDEHSDAPGPFGTG